MRTFSSFIKSTIVVCVMFASTAVFAGAPTWTRVDYTNTTAFVGEVKINFYDAGFPITVEAGDYIGAFVNGECRMIAQVFSYNSSLFVSAVIHGGDVFGANSAEIVEYKVWDNSASAEITRTVKGTMQSAPGGEVLDYIIGKPNTNSQLATLSVTGVTLSPAFATATTTYAVSMTAGSTLPNLASYITTLVDTKRATVVIDPATNFTTDKITTITVTAEDGTTTVYSITYTELACTVLAPTVSDVSYCQYSVATPLTATGTNLKWYTVSTGGSALGTAPTPITTTPGVTTYYVSQTTTCESPRASIVVTVNSSLSPTILANPGFTVCQGTSINLSVTGAVFTSTTWSGSASPYLNSTAIAAPTFSSTAPAGVYSITVNVTDANSCTGTHTQTITVNAIPTTVPTSNAPICEGTTLQLSTPSIAGASFAWTGPNSFTSSQQNPTRTNATTAMNGVYSVIATLNGCTSLAGTTTVVINAIPTTPVPTSNAPICEGSTLQLNTPNVTGGVFAWTGPSVFTSSLQNPTRTNATTAMNGVYSVTATVNGCTSIAGTTTVVINAIPTTPVPTSNAPICEGSTLQLNTPNVTGGVFAWTGPSVFTSSLQNPTRTNATTAMNGVYSVTATASGCTSAAGSVSVVINAIPAAPTVTSTVSYCTGASATQLAATGTNLLWYTAATGGTGNAVAPTPSTSTVGITCYWVSQTVGTCESARSQICVTVNPLPTVSITPSATEVCSDGTIALTLVPATGGLLTGPGTSGLTFNPALANVGANGLTYAYTDGNGCSNSATTSITVDQKSLPTTTQSISLQIGDPSPTLTATGSGTIKWYNSSNVLQVTNASYAPGIITSSIGTYTYYVTNTNGICESATVTVTVSVTACATAAPTVVSPVNYCIGATASALSATGTGSLLWYTIPTGGTGSTTAPTPNTSIVGTTTYYVSQTTTCEGARASITVNVNPLPTVSITPSVSEVSTDGTLTFTLVPSTGGTLTGPGVTGLTFNPAIVGPGTYVFVYSYTDGNGCSNSATTSNITVCEKTLPTTTQTISLQLGDSSPTLTATGSGIIKWYNSSNVLQVTNASYAPGINTSSVGTYTYYVTNSNGICESNPVTVTVTVSGCSTPAPIVTSPVNYCVGATASTLTATGNNLLWYIVSTGGSGTTAALTPNTGIVGTTTYYVSQTTTCESSRAAIVVNVNANPTVTVTAPTDVCIDGGIVPVTVSPTGGTLSGNGVSGTNFSPIVAGAGSHILTYSYTNASSCSAQAQTTITVTAPVLPVTPASVSVTIGAASPVLAASVSDGGTINWYNSSNVLQNTGTSFNTGINTASTGTYTFYASNIKNGCESSKVTITVTVTSCATPLANFTNTTYSICAGAPFPTITGSGTFLKWYSDAALTTLVITGASYQPTAAGTWYVTNTDVCASSAVTVSVNTVALPTISIASISNVCDGTATTKDISTLVTKSAGTVAYTITKGSITNAGLVTLAGVGVYQINATITGSTPEACSAQTTASFQVFANPTVSITAPSNVCVDATTSTLTLVPSTGGTLTGPGVTGLTFNPSTAGAGTHTLTYAYTDVNTCSAQAQALITVNAPVLPVTTASISVTIGAATPILTANVSDGGTINWYNSSNVFQNSGSTFNTGINTASTGTYTFYVSNTKNGCETTKVPITVQVTGCGTTLPLFAQTNYSICQGSAFPTITGSGTLLKWYSDAALTTLVYTGNSYQPTSIGTLYVTNTNVCESGFVAIVIQQIAKPAEPVATDVTLCQGQTIPALTATGSNLKWFNSSMTQITAPVIPTGNGTYYVSQTVNGCESNMKQITVTINPLPSAPIVQNVTVTYGDVVPNLTATGTSLTWYDNSLLQNGTITQSFATNRVDVGEYTYYVTQKVNGCESNASQIKLIIECFIAPPTLVTIQQSVCQGVNATFNAIISTGNSAVWTNSLDVEVANTPAFTTNIAGTYYVKQQNADASCESEKTEAVLFVKPIPTAPVIANIQTCEGVQGQLSNSVQTKWYNTATSTTPLYTGFTYSPSETQPNSYTYYASQVENGCESPKSTVTYTINAKPVISVTDVVADFGASIPNLTATTAPANTVKWYAMDRTTLLYTGNSYATGETQMGLYTYYAEATDAQLCVSDKMPMSLQITDCSILAPTVTATSSNVCVGSTNPTLEAQGTYSIRWYSDAALSNLVSSNASFLPTDVAQGTYTYYAVQQGTCVSPAKSISYKINALPTPQIYAPTSVLITDSPVLITVSPLGGSLSGIGLSGNTFVPSIVTPGNYNITYLYTSVNNCTASVIHTIQVINVVVVDRTQLGDTIARANQIYFDNFSNPSYPTSAKIDLDNAITIAQYYYDNYLSYTNAELLTQTLALSQAINDFLNSQSPSLNFSALQAKIAEANLTYSSNLYREGTAVGNIPSLSFTELLDQIDIAQDLVANPPLTQLEVDNAVITLQSAIDDFLDSEIPPLTVTGISVPENLIRMVIGDTYTPVVTYTPIGATGSIQWVSNNTSVASVTVLSGVITARESGVASIVGTLLSDPSISVTIVVQVSATPQLVSATMNDLGNQIILTFSEPMDEPNSDIYTEIDVLGVNPALYVVSNIQRDASNQNVIVLSIVGYIDNPSEVTVEYAGTSLTSQAGAPVAGFSTNLTVGIEVVDVNILVYPTITSSEVNLVGISQATSLVILSSNGQIVKTVKVTNDSEQLDVSNLAQGAYTILIKKNDKVITKATFVKK